MSPGSSRDHESSIVLESVGSSRENSRGIRYSNDSSRNRFSMVWCGQNNLVTHSLRLQDHSVRMQGWESVCWGGSPYFRLINVRWFPSFPYFRLVSVGWFPSLKIEKFIGFTTFPFHVFDRYEIHIQAFADVIKPICMFCRSSSL